MSSCILKRNCTELNFSKNEFFGKVALATSTMAQSTWNLILMISSLEKLNFSKIEFQNKNSLLNSFFFFLMTFYYIFFKIVMCLDDIIRAFKFGFEFE